MIDRTTLLLVAAIGLLVATLAGFAGGYWWFAELFVHFRPHYVVAAVLLVAAGAVLRSVTLVGVSIASLMLNVLPVWAFVGESAASAPAGADVVKLVSANIGNQGSNGEKIVSLIDEQSPDVLLLIELTPAALAESQAALDNAFPYTYVFPRTDYFGIGLFSRYPLADRRLLDLGYKDVPAISARVVTANGTLRLVGIHLEWPLGSSVSRGRNRQLANLPTALRDLEDRNIVLLGDFNLTRWTSRFDDLLQATGLVDAGAGFGWQPTWPSWLPGVGITIDHCLASPSLQIKDVARGPDVGSDHFPLIVEIAL